MNIKVNDLEIERLRGILDAKEMELALLREQWAQLNHLPQQNKIQNAELDNNLKDKLLDLVLNNSAEGVFLVDPITNRITYCNRRACELFGFDSEKDLIGRNGESLHKTKFSPEQVASANSELWLNGTWSSEIEYNDGKGGTFWGSLTSNIIYDQDRPVLIVRVLNIDERKNAENALKQSERKIREILEHSQAMICAHDMDGIILSVNPAIIRALGYESDNDLIGKDLSVIFGLNHRSKSIAYLLRIKKVGFVQGTLKVFDKFGQSHFWIFSNYKVESEFAGPYVIASAQDITDRVRAEKDLKEAKAAAEVLLKNRELFLANVSHELRTPLHGILGMVSIMNETQRNELDGKYLDVIRQSADNLLFIINDILDIAKIESGKFELESNEFFLKETISNTLIPLKLKASAKGLYFKEFMENPEVLLRGDANRLSQVVTNLVNNAIKFTNVGGVDFYLKVTQENRFVNVSLTVKDSGIGIPKEKQGAVFKEYEQAHKGYGGTGLGLAICKRLVEMQEGSISFESKDDGSGTAFFVNVPYLKVNEIQLAENDKILWDRAMLKGLSVLVVEDNPFNQLICKHILESNGMEVEMAGDGIIAIEKYIEGNQSLVLMDIQIPELNGEEITRFIRSLEGERARVPIIALTANAMKGDHERYLSVGMDGYLSKPYTEEDLLNKISEVLTECNYKNKSEWFI